GLRRSIATGAGVTVGATMLMGAAAQAATFTVGTTNDGPGAGNCAVPTNTDCTLREAINDANGAAYSTITFASGLSGTIHLSGALDLPQIVAAGTHIQGPGSGQLAIDAGHDSRIFNTAATDAQISGLTIENGTAPTGGGIWLQAGQLTVANSVVTGN